MSGDTPFHSAVNFLAKSLSCDLLAKVHCVGENIGKSLTLNNPPESTSLVLLPSSSINLKSSAENKLKY